MESVVREGSVENPDIRRIGDDVILVSTKCAETCAEPQENCGWR
ncbi:MAG: hypothetical protein RSC40_06030 [Clostridia bacterium]